MPTPSLSFAPLAAVTWAQALVKGSSLVSLPCGEPERSAAHAEKPSWVLLVLPWVCLLALLLWGLWCFQHGAVVAGAVLVALTGLLSAGAIFMLLQETQRLCGPKQGDLLTPEERAALSQDGDTPEAARALACVHMGTLLGRPVAFDEKDVRAQGLTPAELTTLEQNRQVEAEATERWLDAMSDPRLVEITASDGTQLLAHVLYTDRTSPRWVILAHDYGSFWTEMLVHARRYAGKHFNLLIPELRAHHGSAGTQIGAGLLDGQDMLAWARWIVNEEDAKARIVLHGHSLGAAAVCVAAGEATLPSGVVAAVADSAFSDAWNVLVHGIKAASLWAHPLADWVRLGLLMRPGGYDLAQANITQAVAHAQIPLLFMHGEQDGFVPPYMAKRLYDAASGSAAGENKQLCLFPTAGHCAACLADPRRYYHALFSFIEKRC